MLLEKGKLNSSLILNSYSIKQQIVPINIYFTGSTDLIRSFLEDLLSMIIYNREAHNNKNAEKAQKYFPKLFPKR